MVVVKGIEESRLRREEVVGEEVDDAIERTESRERTIEVAGEEVDDVSAGEERR